MLIDVHTHAYTRRWLEILKEQGGDYHLKTPPDGHEEIFRGDTPVAFPQLAFHHALSGTGCYISGCCSHYSELLTAIDRKGLFVTFQSMGRSEWPESSQ